jgi:hypothetical protein
MYRYPRRVVDHRLMCSGCQWNEAGGISGWVSIGIGRIVDLGFIAQHLNSVHWLSATVERRETIATNRGSPRSDLRSSLVSSSSKPTGCKPCSTASRRNVSDCPFLPWQASTQARLYADIPVSGCSCMAQAGLYSSPPGEDRAEGRTGGLLSLAVYLILVGMFLQPIHA